MQMSQDDMEQGIVVLGAGAHARVVLSVLRCLRRIVRGCLAPEPPSPGDIDVPWLGQDDILNSLSPNTVLLANGVGSTGTTVLRQEVFLAQSRKGFSFITMVHPSAIVDDTVHLEEGAQVMAGAVLQARVRIGRNAIINTGAIVDHDCIVSEHAHVAPGACLSGGVTVGAGAHIGAGTVVIQGVSIGCAALVGAGSVVLRDVGKSAISVGNPARLLRSNTDLS